MTSGRHERLARLIIDLTQRAILSEQQERDKAKSTGSAEKPRPAGT